MTCPAAFFSWYCRQQRRVRGAGGASYSLSFDCESEHDTAALSRVLDVLADRALKASFAVVGRLVEKRPDLYKRIVAEGHEVLNHTYSHPERDANGGGRQFNELSREDQRQEIVRCHEVCLAALDYAPVGFRAPHFAETFGPHLYPVLEELGYRYSSSTVSVETSFFGSPFRTGGVWEVPVSCSVADPFHVFDSWTGKRRCPSAESFVRTFGRTIECGIRARAYLSHYFDPSHVVEGGVLDRMCDLLLLARREAVVGTYRETVIPGKG